jgi:hypothetical protein
MLAFILQRVMQALIVMLVISVLVFVGVYAIGNPIDVVLSPDAPQDIRLATIAAYGFDQPLWKQYLSFLRRLAQADFGRSFIYNVPVLSLILSRLPATLEITRARSWACTGSADSAKLAPAKAKSVGKVSGVLRVMGCDSFSGLVERGRGGARAVKGLLQASVNALPSSLHFLELGHESAG